MKSVTSRETIFYCLRRARVAALFALVLTGCGAEADFGETAEVETDQLKSAIMGANPSRNYASVKLTIQRNGSSYSCSGTVLNNRIIVTAGHCFVPQGASPRNKHHDIVIEYEAPDRDYVWSIDDAFTYVHPNYVRGQDAHDMAVVALEADQSLTADIQGRDRLRPNYPGGSPATYHYAHLHWHDLSGREVKVTGYGVGNPDGGSRTIRLNVEEAWKKTVRWERKVIGQAVCSGDSGSGAFRPSGAADLFGFDAYRPLAFVITSVDANTGNGNACDPEGYGVRVRRKTDWIREISEYWTDRECFTWNNYAGEDVLVCPSADE